eukprot:1839830-Prorocentrum_lima.AAC.1
MKENGTTKTWKAKSGMVICGNFASENQALCESTSAHNVDIGLLRMMPSMTKAATRPSPPPTSPQPTRKLPS